MTSTHRHRVSNMGFPQTRVLHLQNLKTGIGQNALVLEIVIQVNC